MSIRRRLFLVITVLFGLGFYFMIDFIVDDIEKRYRESTEEPLVDTARVLAAIASSTVVDRNIDIDLFRKSFEQVQGQIFSAQIFGLLKTHVDLHVYMTNRLGIVIFDSDLGKAEGQDYSEWRDVLYTLLGKYGARTSLIDENVDAEDKKMLYIASPIMYRGQLIGVLSVGKPTRSSSKFIKAARNKLIIGSTLLCLVLIGLGLLLGAWITRPIQTLTDYAKAVRDGKRVKRPVFGSHEMEELGASFEAMRDALDGKHYVEHYVQTLTHEIKSPVSAIRGAVELLSEDLPAEKRRTLLSNIDQESDRIHQIVDNLLLLASLESRKFIHSAERIHIAELLDEIETVLKPLLAVNDMTLNRQDNADLVLQGEVNLITQALLNVLHNAIDFSPASSTITLTVKRANNTIVFEISDQGPGIPDYAKDRVFERFYSLKRPQTGRKSTGLGLSLVNEIMLLHQGQVAIENSLEGGAIVRLAFPLA